MKVMSYEQFYFPTTDGRTDGPTDRQTYIAVKVHICGSYNTV